MNQTTNPQAKYQLDVYRVSLEVIGELKMVVRDIRSQDRALAVQLTNAINSVSLNVGEGHYRAGRDRIQHWRIAAGSANEVRACLEVAQAWGWLDEQRVAPIIALVNRVLAMLWKMTR